MSKASYAFCMSLFSKKQTVVIPDPLVRCSLLTQMVKKSECLLFPGGMYIFEIWHIPLNVSTLAKGGKTMKKKKIYGNGQMNLGS